MFNNIPPSGFPQIDLSQDVKRINAEISGMTSDCTNILTDITAETATLSGNPITLSDALATDAISVVAEIEPSQDLHGYDRPWSGGSGKNKLPMTVDGIKAVNTSGTWSGNDYSINSGTFTILTDDDGNVTGIKASGTFSTTSRLYLCGNVIPNQEGQAYTFNGCPNGGGDSTYRLQLTDGQTSSLNVNDNGDGNTYNGGRWALGVTSCVVIYQTTSIDKTFLPMIRLATETNATFEPYTNICPISGMTEVNVQRVGKNLCGEIEQGSLSTYGEKTTSSTRVCTKDFVRVLPNSSIAISSSANVQGYVLLFDEIGNERINSPSWQSLPYTIATGSTVKYCKVMFRKSDDSNITPSDATNVQIEIGQTATTYKPYSSTTATVSLGTTIYGGSVDMTEGSASVTMANIASYNGETINEPWLSSMDEYVSGATPTTGAQVVYTLATPTTLSLTPATLAMLEGENTVSTDAEEVSVEYIKNTLVGRVRRLEEEQ